ncbi:MULTISPECIES: tRNA-uridine aminocarboxypropyltransferase [Halomonas]|uniref:tRNA-uridine aminocarboxypropyltransferase n=1 Tax=Halomonas TaxID=2745 RepID=UPI001C978AC6|nr:MULTISPECIES: DTW domain-containing protein [Halomonas]MBY5983878.1 DTW domain-containing protein [Halomonas sp. DP5Y7-2]MBY6207421.1 DTW domain-containing protein [Halomonas sp. DP3Y7-2]MBY6228230.1 DTW domain-containing protein [Halomonas sp. DP3Y7-1]MCA0916296.1 DTW domain-containing protein [Halomonas denitrificans]
MSDGAESAAVDPATGHPRPPRREFKARGSFVTRCEGCNLPELNCLCPYQAKADSRVQVWLMTHPLEHHKPTNTGRLIADVLATTRVFTWYRTAPDDTLLALLADPRYAPFVVFPDDQPDYADRVVEVEAVTQVEDARIPVLILLDGTWRQARRIFRKSPYLEHLPVLPLRTDRLTRYQLRKPASQAHLCTAEVAAELLRQSGEVAAAQVLDDYFDVFNDSYAASRHYTKIETPTPSMTRLAALRRAQQAPSSSTEGR